MINKPGYFLCAAALLTSCATGSETASSARDVIFADYQELPDPEPAADAAWESQVEPLYACFGSTNTRYAKTRVPGFTGLPEPNLKNGRPDWKGKAWKGERVHMQAVLWATEDIPGVSLRVSELLADQGASIPASAVSTGFVRYVMTDEFSEGCGARKPMDFDSSLVADAIDVIPSMNISARTVRPVWIQIDVPREAKPGNYAGTITIENERGIELAPLKIDLTVQEHTLPPPSDWDFHLDLWQNPFAESRVHQVKNWSPEHFQAMKPSMQLLAEAGQKVITASIIYDPWNSQTYDVYDSMVRWVKKADGSWEYDYSVFDKWVEYMSELGIDQQINCYSMVPWNLKFYYYDEALGKDTLIVAEPGSAAYDAHWRPMLESFAAHLREKGWFERTAIAMDERPLEAMQEVIKLVKSVDGDFKIALAGNYHAEIAPDIYDYCIGSGQEISADTMQLRRNEAKKTTYYTCCVEAYPNTFTFSPPAESTWLAWHSAAKGYDGYLRWAYNSWVQDPLKDSRFRAWPAGDTYLVYPGARSSIRFEKMIDGIEDYVKIRVLREKLKEKGDTAGLERLDAMLLPFRDISNLARVPAGEMLKDAYKILEQF